MNTYYALVFSSPKDGMESEFNRWYNKEHAPDVVAIPGFVSGQRYRLAEEQLMTNLAKRPRYLVIYKIVTDDLEKVYGEVHRRLKNGETRMSKSISFTGGMNKTYKLRFFSFENVQGEATPIHVVLGDTEKGKEQEFINWYNNVHGPEISSGAGFTGEYALGTVAQVQMIENPAAQLNMAIFGIEPDSLQGIWTTFKLNAPKLSEGPPMKNLWSSTYEPTGPLILHKN